jgi:putative ABC transport system permease protein
MVLGENFRVAFGALRANKMRSILTMLGIIIGVASVIAVVSIVQGVQFMATNVFEGVGATLIFVFPDSGDREGPGIVGRQVRLTWDDGEAILDRVPGVLRITPLIAGRQSVRYKERKHDPELVLGVNENWQEVMNYTVDRGRFFSKLDLETRNKVAAIGQDIVDELSLGQEPIGKQIYVGDLPVQVIGVMEEKGQTLGQNLDDLVFLPFDTALTLFGRNAGDRIQLRVQAVDTASVERVKDGIQDLLRQRHKIAKDQPDDFQVVLQDEILKSITGFLGGLTAVVGGVVSIALLVGGIGIMNIMLVSVTERTREIGTRKAVGARRQDILVQFLIEAVTLSLAGGALGVLVGWGLGALVAGLLPAGWPPAHVPLWAVAVAFGFSVLVGVFFGIYPAGKAARLDPIEALRYE